MAVSKCKYTLLLLVIVAGFVLLRLPFLDLPMERDEGEFATLGQGMIQGIPPYSDSYTMKFPGGASLYALTFALLGPSPQSIRITLIFFNSATLFLVGLLGCRFFDARTGLFAAASFGTLSLGLGCYGLWLSAEHFATFFLILGAWILGHPAKNPRTRNLILGSLSLGASILCKHHALFPSLTWLGVYLMIFLKRDPGQRDRRAILQSVILLFSFIIPFLLLLVLMKFWGVFDPFWFWTIQYASTYASSVPMTLGWEYFKSGAWRIFLDGPLLWMMTLTGGSICLYEWRQRRKSNDPIERASGIPSLLVGTSLLGALMAASAGLLFRGQYFIYSLPFASMLAGITWSRMTLYFDRKSLKGGFACGAILCASFIVLIEPVLHGIHRQPQKLLRLVYGMNPFPEYRIIADWISKKTKPQDKVLVAGSEPSLYFLSKRRPAIPYLCVYEFMKNHPSAQRMQLEAIEKVQRAQPPVIVYVDVPTSWGASPSSDRTFQNWLRGELDQSYTLDGIIDLISEDRVEFRWEGESQKYGPQSPYTVRLYVRKSFFIPR
jgi:hypothetical protein